jgi:hypothetical protein
MNTMAVLAIGALGLAVITLFRGVRSMAHGGEEDDRDSTPLMLTRCAWQAAAFAFVLLAMLTRSNGF